VQKLFKNSVIESLIDDPTFKILYKTIYKFALQWVLLS